MKKKLLPILLFAVTTTAFSQIQFDLTESTVKWSGKKITNQVLKTKKKVDEFTTIAKKDFSSLANQYGLMCKKLVENQKQRIDYWQAKGEKIIK